MVAPSKNIILNLYIGINGLAYERLLTVKAWSNAKFLLKMFFFAKIAIFYKNVSIKTILLVNPSSKYFLAYIQK